MLSGTVYVMYPQGNPSETIFTDKKIINVLLMLNRHDKAYDDLMDEGDNKIYDELTAEADRLMYAIMKYSTIIHSVSDDKSIVVFYTNIARNDNDPDIELTELVTRGISIASVCDYVVFAPDWETSPECRIMYSFAKEHNPAPSTIDLTQFNKYSTAGIILSVLFGLDREQLGRSSYYDKLLIIPKGVQGNTNVIMYHDDQFYEVFDNGGELDKGVMTPAHIYRNYNVYGLKTVKDIINK